MSIAITPLSAHPLPPTYLLTVDNAHILLDCGAYDRAYEATLHDGAESRSADVPTTEQVTAYLASLRALAPSLSLVLLSHPLLISLGLLPFLRARCGLRCPVYATLPTREMGRYAVEEWVEARSAAERNDVRIEQKGAGYRPLEAAAAGSGGAGLACVMVTTGTPAKVELPVEAFKVTQQEIGDALVAISVVCGSLPTQLTAALLLILRSRVLLDHLCSSAPLQR
ncbi:hypothetical protein Rhopal_005873-T1 [Rhodotorula paludigena]|uniref:Cleavage and polyadenylation specificity factor subunit 2 n=1 Tax=Rhodotorula paludigena TaxID=86838 RepID=A0AAV5GSB4_9BASI|nr:hypothetical protein Rhopal_005872-T1 [Rhodotorula paludigena]GJN92835.1 hypothetical protein Rhopal_005873-T1 [Rhodotorula paludigena]